MGFKWRGAHLSCRLGSRSRNLDNNNPVMNFARFVKHERHKSTIGRELPFLRTKTLFYSMQLLAIFLVSRSNGPDEGGFQSKVHKMSSYLINCCDTAVSAHT